MSKELVVEGDVRRVDFSEKPGKNPGQVYRNGKIVLGTPYDKLEIQLGMGASDALIARFKAVPEGAHARLHVEVSSGNGWQEEPRFTFVNDLTAAGPKG